MKKALPKDKKNRVWLKRGFSLKGFTLIELLLAITLFAVVAVAIYSSMAIGIKVQKRGGSLGAGDSDLSLALDIMTGDLRNAIKIDDLTIKEESDKLFFYSQQQGIGGASEIYKITYSTEGGQEDSKLTRLQQPYVDSLTNVPAKGEEILDKVRKIDFDYGYLKKKRSGGNEFSWHSTWKEEWLPKLVQARLELAGEEVIKIIYCPAGKMGEIKEE